MSDIARALKDCQAKLGQEIGVSDWITVDQERIDAFAEITRDDQWIHVDPARAAAQAPFGGTIAHGFLSLSLASRFAYDCFEDYPGQVMGINYGFDRLRFLTPVRAGARLRGRFVLASVEQRSPTRLLRKVSLSIEIEGAETPALAADWLGLLVFEE